MFGVVLWHDAWDRALVWCEDQGELAFYDATGDAGASDRAEAVRLRTGDYIRFEFDPEQKQRVVQNPVWLSGNHALKDLLLAEMTNLAKAQISNAKLIETPTLPRQEAQILTFPDPDLASGRSSLKAG